MGSKQGEEGSGELPRYEGQCEAAIFRRQGVSPVKHPGQAGVRDQKEEPGAGEGGQPEMRLSGLRELVNHGRGMAFILEHTTH